MPKYCRHCEKEISEESRKELCDDCRKEEVDAYYTYSQLRFEIWQFLKMHGPVKTREVVFNKMVAEEGMEWVIDALGKELVDEITHPGDSS
jgi:hypothetical protein